MLQMKTTSNRRRSPTEDNPNTFKIEYLNNQWFDLNQIFNLRIDIEYICYSPNSYFQGKLYRKPQRKSRVWLCSAQPSLFVTSIAF